MSRLETLVCAIAPTALANIYKLSRPLEAEELSVLLRGVVGMAAILERAIADEELHQMSRPPPKPGDRDG
jgi:hypothetical protein